MSFAEERGRSSADVNQHSSINFSGIRLIYASGRVHPQTVQKLSKGFRIWLVYFSQGICIECRLLQVFAQWNVNTDFDAYS